jgi:hypothetical protein
MKHGDRGCAHGELRREVTWVARRSRLFLGQALIVYTGKACQALIVFTETLHPEHRHL